MIKVRAAFSQGKFGFYGNQRRYDGEEFEITDEKHFSEKWMIRISPPVKAKSSTSKAKKDDIDS